MKNLHFPLHFRFRISTIANDFVAKDASERTIAYVRQKLFKLKEAIDIYNNEEKTELLYTIKADKWLDFNTAYAFKDAQGNELGKIVRKGWRSLWKAEYELIDQHGELQYHIREKNPWVKVMDGFVGEIPIVNFFSGYMFNPAYVLTDLAQKPYAILQKNASFFGRKFTLQKLEEIDADDEARIALGFMMMILLERRRG